MTALTIVRRAMGVTIAHTFFAYPDRAAGADIEQASQVAEAREGWDCVEFATLLLDLGRGEDVLWGEVKGGCRQEIRRARERDALEVEILDAPTATQIDEFLRFFDTSARIKGLERGNAQTLRRLAEAGGLALGRIASADGAALAQHAHVVAEGRARLLHSAIRREPDSTSEANALRGRANRLLHWREICHFRERGLGRYDFGGLALGARGGTLAGVDAFKQTFGGETATEFKCRRPSSSLGRLALGSAALAAAARRTFTRVQASWGRGGERGPS